MRHFRTARSFCLWVAVVLAWTLSSRAQINISPLSSDKPISSGKKYGDIWGEGDIACLGIWTGYNNSPHYGVGIYNISNPANPVLLSTYLSPHSANHNQFEQGVVRDRIGYFASWSGGGLHIVSLTNPVSPVLLSRITATLTGPLYVTNGFNEVHTMFLERNFLYEAAHRAGNTTVKVFDVSNPSTPVFLQNIVTTNTTKVHQITVGQKGTNSILYTSGWGGNSDGNPNSYGQTDIWDVSSVGTQPARWLGRLYSGYSSHSSWPTPDGNTLVVCRETPGGEVRFYDISTPPNPSPSSITNPAPFLTISPASVGIAEDIPHNPVIVSNLLFLSWYQNGIQVFDITDRTKPVRVGAYDTFPGAKTASYEGNWGVYPFLGLNKVLLSDIQSGMFVIDASAVITGTNNYPPLMVRSPVSLTTTQGMTATLSPIVTGSTLQYQWLFNGTNISGATSSSYVLNSAQPSDSGSYRVRVFNNSGSVTSAVATLTVVISADMLPAITAQPQDVAVYAEQSAMFSVAAVGSGPMFYQWLLNGTPIANATNQSFTRVSVQPEQAGAYSVLITNSYGSTVSSNAFLTLIDSPYISNVRSSSGSRSAVIGWQTSLPADSQVQFDPATAPSQLQMAAASAAASFGNSSYIDSALTTNHNILLTGLTPGTSYNFQVVSAVNGSNFLSGVYSFRTAGGGPIILDNTNSQVSITGTWMTNNLATDRLGDDYRFANVTSGAATATAIYRPNLPSTGKYDVHIYYPQGGNRAVNTPYTVFHKTGSQTFLVNQQVNGGGWRLLGRFSFSSGTDGYVRIANNASGGNVVMADGVSFTYIEEQDFPTDGSVPGWWDSFYFGSAANPVLDHDADGYSTAQEYLLGTSPVDSTKRLSVRLFRSGGNLNVTFWPFLGNRDYFLQNRTDISSGSWGSLAAGTIYPDQYGGGTFTIGINSARNYYRISANLVDASQFIGFLETPPEKSFSPYATDPLCGPNRAYLK